MGVRERGDDEVTEIIREISHGLMGWELLQGFKWRTDMFDLAFKRATLAYCFENRL